jgi:transcriptional regulator with XRE-family HTH domain
MNKQLKSKIIERYGSQADFAQRMRVDDSVVSRIIRGRRSLSPQDVKRWSKALKCDPSLLETEK